ncbi:MAG: hypothetical protein ACRCT6_11335 [Notoacmeibacter sp.]
MPASLALPMSKNQDGLGLEQMRRDEPGFAITGFLLALTLPIFLAAAALDDRLHLGINIWDKPAKFAAALSIYLLTLAFFARYLPADLRQKTSYKIYSASVVFAVIAEMVWIGGAAAFGTSSHFNTENPLLAAVYPVMGALATLLTSATAVYAWQIYRNNNLTLSPVMKTALVFGLGLTLPLTLMTAGTMSSLTGHSVGGTGLDTNSIALIGWLRDAGDLRVGHFFATHALHGIPLAGVVSSAIFGPNKTWPVLVFSALYSAFVVFTFVQALNGQPFI